MTDKELDCLRRIKAEFDDLFILYGRLHDFRPEVLAGIAMRESNGRPFIVGDGGHGHGLMQIDDRWEESFCHNPVIWQNPEMNLNKACRILADKRRQIKRECTMFKVEATPEQLEQMMIAAYNCGADHTVHQLRNGLDIDGFTTGKDYSKCVLAFAEAYKEL